MGKIAVIYLCHFIIYNYILNCIIIICLQPNLKIIVWVVYFLVLKTCSVEGILLITFLSSKNGFWISFKEFTKCSAASAAKGVKSKVYASPLPAYLYKNVRGSTWGTCNGLIYMYGVSTKLIAVCHQGLLANCWVLMLSKWVWILTTLFKSLFGSLLFPFLLACLRFQAIFWRHFLILQVLR